jgi:hypothetical protein
MGRFDFLWGLRGLTGLLHGSLLACVLLGFSHVMHLPEGKHQHQSKYAQFQPNTHFSAPVASMLVEICPLWAKYESG